MAHKELVLDEVDRGILYALQQDARNVTIQEIAAEVDVSGSTVRNRIEAMESMGVIEGYAPKINYERAGFSLNIMFICSADPDDREAVAQDVLEVPGIIDVDEMLTSERNLHVKAVATNTLDLADITAQLNEYGLIIHSSEIISNNYTQPWSPFEYGADEE
ncbi:Lrp/AsnC family transcriptional regulator [Haladaptatus sp. DFWS20]|uniref:Lrp/AsnC family transcriptional regulator n=1 Tax=Haladaptatus sp. DFWS20 TaxID=3403467 RepID=UPI003EB7D9C1